MLGVTRHRAATIRLAARLDQVQRVKQIAAVIALVAARFLEATNRTSTLDVTVRQKAPFRLRVELRLGVTVEKLRLMKAKEEVLGDTMVVFGVRVGEEIVADANGLLGLQESVVVILENLARRLSTPVGLNRDRGAMGVGAGDHQNAVSPQAVVAREDVGRQVGAGQMADVQIAVGIRPGDGDMDGFGHRIPSLIGSPATKV